jgi:hypothetical protein
LTGGFGLHQQLVAQSRSALSDYAM